MHCAHTVYLCLILSSQDRLRTLTEYCAVRCEPNLYVQCKADRLQFGLQPSRCVNQSKYQIKELFYSVGTQQIIYYQSINLATCFGSSSHHQAKSQTILKVHSVVVHIVGSYGNKRYRWLFAASVSSYYKTQSICRNKSILN